MEEVSQSINSFSPSTQQEHRIHICDKPEKYEDVKREFDGRLQCLGFLPNINPPFAPGRPGIAVFRDGYGVSRSADWIMYCVEAEFIDRVVAQFGPGTSDHIQ